MSRPASHGRGWLVRTGFSRRRFALPFAKQFVLLMKRQAKLTLRNKQLLRAKVGQQIVMGVLAGTLFYQMDLAKAPPAARFLDRLPLPPAVSAASP